MRPSWNQYFMDLAKAVATRATCPRKSVGCVIVKDRQVVASGYNGSIPGAEHCTDAGCLLENGHCTRTVHSEVNAVAQAARRGVSIEGADVYCTLQPCWPCLKTLLSAGVENVYFGAEYGTEYPIEVSKVRAL